ncbi:MAG: HDIG domain-containing metalloprotein, partial [Patescibacteria group bacterium]
MKAFVELNQPKELSNETEIIEWLKQNPWLDNLINSKNSSVELNRALENNELIEYPELTRLTETPEDPTYHGEKNTWAHTLLVLDEVEKITNREKLSTKDTIIIKLGALCHDLGKPLVTKVENGKVTAYQHEKAGEPPAYSLLNKIETPKEISDSIIPLVKEHLY